MTSTRGCGVCEVLQRDVNAIGALIVQHRVAMKERAAPAVLPADAHREAVLDERGVGERFRAAPVERHLAREHLLAVAHDVGDAGVQRQVRRQLQQSLAERLQTRQLHAGTHPLRPVGLGVSRPVDRELVADHAECGARLRPPLVEPVAILLQHRVGIRLREGPLGHEPLARRVAAWWDAGE